MAFWVILIEQVYFTVYFSVPVALLVDFWKFGNFYHYYHTTPQVNNLRVYFDQNRVGTVKRQTKMVLLSFFFCFCRVLLCFMMVKLLYLSLESDEFEESEKMPFVFKQKGLSL